MAERLWELRASNEHRLTEVGLLCGLGNEYDLMWWTASAPVIDKLAQRTGLRAFLKAHLAAWPFQRKVGDDKSSLAFSCSSWHDPFIRDGINQHSADAICGF